MKKGGKAPRCPKFRTLRGECEVCGDVTWSYAHRAKRRFCDPCVKKRLYEAGRVSNRQAKTCSLALVPVQRVLCVRCRVEPRAPQRTCCATCWAVVDSNIEQMIRMRDPSKARLHVSQIQGCSPERLVRLVAAER